MCKYDLKILERTFKWCEITADLMCPFSPRQVTPYPTFSYVHKMGTSASSHKLGARLGANQRSAFVIKHSRRKGAFVWLDRLLLPTLQGWLA